MGKTMSRMLDWFNRATANAGRDARIENLHAELDDIKLVRDGLSDREAQIRSELRRLGDVPESIAEQMPCDDFAKRRPDLAEEIRRAMFNDGFCPVVMGHEVRRRA